MYTHSKTAVAAPLSRRKWLAATAGLFLGLASIGGAKAADDTIKVAGKRLGPAEVETVLVNDPAVVEAGAIGVPDALKGQALVVFCVLAPGIEPSDELAAALRTRIAGAMGKSLTPKAVVFVPDLPKTRNAKVMRRVLRAAWLDEPAGDLSALVNPEVVDAIRQAGSASSR